MYLLCKSWKIILEDGIFWDFSIEHNCAYTLQITATCCLQLYCCKNGNIDEHHWVLFRLISSCFIVCMEFVCVINIAGLWVERPTWGIEQCARVSSSQDLNEKYSEPEEIWKFRVLIQCLYPPKTMADSPHWSSHCNRMQLSITFIMSNAIGFRYIITSYQGDS